ncbi:MAG: hypothetical protein AAGA88_06870 [Pseudomonadota bacterium]
MADAERPTLRYQMVMGAFTAALLFGGYQLFEYLSDAVRRPPFRGTLVAEFRLVSALVATIIAVSAVHFIVTRAQSLIEKRLVGKTQQKEAHSDTSERKRDD